MKENFKKLVDYMKIHGSKIKEEEIPDKFINKSINNFFRFINSPQ